MSHDAGHAPKPFANPVGILMGLLILWVAAGGLVWVLFKIFGVGTEAGG